MGFALATFRRLIAIGKIIYLGDKYPIVLSLALTCQVRLLKSAHDPSVLLVIHRDTPRRPFLEAEFGKIRVYSRYQTLCLPGIPIDFHLIKA